MQEEFYFARVNDAIIVPAKKNRTGGCTEEETKSIHDNYYRVPKEKILTNFLIVVFLAGNLPVTQMHHTDTIVLALCIVYTRNANM